MTVQELIAELNQMPADYEVQTFLSRMPPENAGLDEVEKCMDDIQARSAFIFGCINMEQEKEVYLLGTAWP